MSDSVLFVDPGVGALAELAGATNRSRLGVFLPQNEDYGELRGCSP